MKRLLTFTAAAAAALSLAAPALAQKVALKAHPELNLTGFMGGPNTLPDTVATIERNTGGHVLEIRYDNVAGVPGYSFVVANGPKISFERFSKPGVALVALAGHSEPRWMLDWNARKDARIVRKAKVPLTAAIRTAEQAHNGAPAVAAGIAASASNPASDVHAYNILLFENGQTRRVAVDSDTGAIIANPAALRDWP